MISLPAIEEVLLNRFQTAATGPRDSRPLITLSTVS